MSSLAFFLLCIWTIKGYSSHPRRSDARRGCEQPHEEPLLQAVPIFFPFSDNRQNVSRPEAFSLHGRKKLLLLLFIPPGRHPILFLQMPSDHGFFIGGFQFLIDLPDQFQRHAPAELKLLFKLSSAFLFFLVFNIIANITFIIQISITVYIGDCLLYRLRLKLCLQELFAKLGFRPVHPFQQIQGLNFRFLQLCRLFLRTFLLPAVLLRLVIHNVP